MRDGAAPGAVVVDDYLGLARRDLPVRGLVVFRGRSGSGKTTYLEWLRRPGMPGADEDVAVVDEVLRPRQLAALAGTMARHRLTLAASHLPGPVHLLLRPLGPVVVFDLDRRREKIGRWLERRSVPHGEAALEAFHRRFGANYTDAALVLEAYPGLDFDRALARFLRERSVRHGPAPLPRRAGSRG